MLSETRPDLRTTLLFQPRTCCCSDTQTDEIQITHSLSHTHTSIVDTTFTLSLTLSLSLSLTNCTVALDRSIIFKHIYQVPPTLGGSNIEILRFVPRAINTSSQCSFSLIDVRSDEKTAHRAVILARNADKHGRSRDARPKPFF